MIADKWKQTFKFRHGTFLTVIPRVRVDIFCCKASCKGKKRNLAWELPLNVHLEVFFLSFFFFYSFPFSLHLVTQSCVVLKITWDSWNDIVAPRTLSSWLDSTSCNDCCFWVVFPPENLYVYIACYTEPVSSLCLPVTLCYRNRPVQIKGRIAYVQPLSSVQQNRRERLY